MTFPPEDVLIARGKYATLGSRKRGLMKQLQNCMQAITEQARHVLRYDDDAEVAMSFYMAMQGRITDTGAVLAELSEIHIEMEQLKPAAWAKETHDGN